MYNRYFRDASLRAPWECFIHPKRFDARLGFYLVQGEGEKTHFLKYLHIKKKEKAVKLYISKVNVPN